MFARTPRSPWRQEPSAASGAYASSAASISAETGVLESMAAPLARAGISIFALSTYDTDYLLMPGDDLEAALSALSEAGHAVRRPDAA